MGLMCGTEHEVMRNALILARPGFRFLNDVLSDFLVSPKSETGTGA